MTYNDDQGRPEIVPGKWFGSGRATWRHLPGDPAGDDAGEATHPAVVPAPHEPDQGRAKISAANVHPAPATPV